MALPRPGPSHTGRDSRQRPRRASRRRSRLSRFRSRDGRTLAYRREGAGPLLVCHPGGPGFSGAEFGDLAGLAGRLTLLFLDPRGTGGSDPPSDPGAYSLDDYVADVEERREHLELDRLSLLGFSHGGMVAMAYALAHPDRIDRLVLVNTLAGLDPDLQAEIDRAVAGREGEPWSADAVAALEAEADGVYETPEDMGRLWRAMAPMYFARWNDAAREFVEATSDVGNVESLRLFNASTPDLSGDLARIAAPTLVVTGDRDFVCGPAAARAIAEGIPGAELVVIPDAGHFTYFEQPERFAAVVGAFVTGASG